ncbi:MAG: hypothetical protein JWQ07_4261 [Ramlibacter sp.]|nr:hypothetical protein [Ramlibacter sp.]
MMRMSNVWLGLALAFTAAAPAQALLPRATPERELEMKIQAAPAEDILFLMAYALHPLCKEDQASWSAGASVGTMVSTSSTDPAVIRLSDETNEALRKRFAVQPGERVVTADRRGTPQAMAGLRQGDVLVSVPAAPPAGANRPRESTMELVKRAREENEARLSADPINRLTVRRDGQVFTTAVRNVRVCSMSLSPVDSGHSYADSDGSRVIVTMPLLQGLAPQELKVVLAQEAAQVALGISRNRGLNKAAGELLLGALITLGENKESGLSAPPEQQLISADRLAMRLLIPMGIEPMAYLEILKKLNGDPNMLADGPMYWRTRPLQQKRLWELEAAVGQWAAERKLRLPAGVPVDIGLAVTARMLEAVNEPRRVFAAPADLLQAAPRRTPLVDAVSTPLPAALPGRELAIGERTLQLPAGDWTLAARTQDGVRIAGESVAPMYTVYASDVQDGKVRWSVAVNLSAGSMAARRWSDEPCKVTGEMHKEDTGSTPGFPACLVIYKRRSHLAAPGQSGLYGQAREWMDTRSLKLAGPLYEVMYSRYSGTGFGWVRVFVPASEFGNDEEVLAWSRQLSPSLSHMFGNSETSAALPSLPRAMSADSPR